MTDIMSNNNIKYFFPKHTLNVYFGIQKANYDV